MAVFILEEALFVSANLGKHSLFVWLFVSSVKTGTRRIIHLDELSSVVRLERRTTKDRSPGRIMPLVPVFTLVTNNQTHNECLPKFVRYKKVQWEVRGGENGKWQWIFTFDRCETLTDSGAADTDVIDYFPALS